MAMQFGGLGVTPTLRGQPTNMWTLQPGEVAIVPAGTWYAMLGQYCAIQVFDFISGTWLWAGDNGQGGRRIESDGNNVRIANTTGCAIGSVITNAGTLYTSPPAVAASAGSSIWQAIVGGAINTTVTVSAGGANYGYPPQVLFDRPPTPGRQATGYCTLSGGAVSTVTVTDQGAGYTQAPGVSFVNDPREGVNGVIQGYNAAAYTSLTGAGTITGLLCLDHGTPLTTLPTLTFTGGGGSAAAATVLMDWCITGYSVTTAGASYTALGTASAVEITGVGGFVTTTPAYTNPTYERNALRRRRARIYAPTTTGGGITATGAIVDDGGHYEAAPTVAIVAGTTVVVTAAVVVAFVGGLNDTFSLMPM